MAKRNNVYLLYAHYICSLWKGRQLAPSNYTPSIYIRNLGDRKKLTPKSWLYAGSVRLQFSLMTWQDTKKIILINSRLCTMDIFSTNAPTSHRIQRTNLAQNSNRYVKNMASFCLNWWSFSTDFSFLNFIETSFKERVIFPSDVRYPWLLRIFRRFYFPIVMDDWGGYIF